MNVHSMALYRRDLLKVFFGDVIQFVCCNAMASIEAIHQQAIGRQVQ